MAKNLEPTTKRKGNKRLLGNPIPVIGKKAKPNNYNQPATLTPPQTPPPILTAEQLNTITQQILENIQNLSQNNNQLSK